MSTIFISRHPGAVEWMKNQPIRVDRWMTHLIPEDVHAGADELRTLSCKLEEFIISKPDPSYDSPALSGLL